MVAATDEDYASHNYIVSNEIFNNGWTGINIWRAHKNYISQNIISENAFVGILLDTSNYNILGMNTIVHNSEQGIWIGNSEFNEIMNNYISSNGADSGLNLYHSTYHLVSGNTITENMFGILLEESDCNRLIENTISNNYDTGIQIMGTSSENTIVENIIHHNGASGIAIVSVLLTTDDDYASHNYIARNEIYCNPLVGIGIWSSHEDSIMKNTISDCYVGIYLLGSTFNLIKDNIVSENILTGIIITRESNSNKVKRNVVHGNGRNGIVIAWSSANHISGNCILQNLFNGINLLDSDHTKISKILLWKM